jgi:hypothetical protein
MSEIDTSEIESELASLNSTNESILMELKKLNERMRDIDQYLFTIYLDFKHK